MLMDMFYGATEGVIKHRRRFHFHEVNFIIILFSHSDYPIQLLLLKNNFSNNNQAFYPKQVGGRLENNFSMTKNIG
jgi:hypothetical protein